MITKTPTWNDPLWPCNSIDLANHHLFSAAMASPFTSMILRVSLLLTLAATALLNGSTMLAGSTRLMKRDETDAKEGTLLIDHEGKDTPDMKDGTIQGLTCFSDDSVLKDNCNYAASVSR